MWQPKSKSLDSTITQASRVLLSPEQPGHPSCHLQQREREKPKGRESPRASERTVNFDYIAFTLRPSATMLHHQTPSRFLSAHRTSEHKHWKTTLSRSLSPAQLISLSLSRAYFSLTVCASHRAGAENASSSSSCQTDQKGTLFAATRAAGQTRRGKTLRFSPRPYGSGGGEVTYEGRVFPESPARALQRRRRRRLPSTTTPRTKHTQKGGDFTPSENVENLVTSWHRWKTGRNRSGFLRFSASRARVLCFVGKAVFGSSICGVLRACVRPYVCAWCVFSVCESVVAGGKPHAG